MFHPIPGKFDTLLSQQDRNRIYNLNIFSTVEIYPQDSTYTIFVNESPPYYPIPLMDYNEAKGWSYGLGIKTDNFRGRNESIVGGAMFGEDPVYFLRYSNPWIWGDHIGLTIDLLNINSEHHVYDSLNYEKALYIGSGFQWNKFHNFSGGMGYVQRTIEAISDKTMSSYQFNHIESQMSYTFDSRDVKIDPTMGNLSGIDFSSNWGLQSSPTIHYIELFTQIYILPKIIKIDPVFSYTLKSLFQFTDGDLPYYQKEYLGGEDYVRGYSPTPNENGKFEKYIEVDQLIYQSIQTQFTILPRVDRGGMEMGLDGVFFVDHGMGTTLNSPFKLENSIYGYGFGLRLFMSGFGYIGFDVGFNPSGDSRSHWSDSN
ncbi:MAG: BamA/TamA family outer membrane protein [Candidatus Marinimicrobia bacterium]|nr:BamA/TamA family outer membrane protein [Candidatus Neomarinimicrobiota bacterium]